MKRRTKQLPWDQMRYEADDRRIPVYGDFDPVQQHALDLIRRPQPKYDSSSSEWISGVRDEAAPLIRKKGEILYGSRHKKGLDHWDKAKIVKINATLKALSEGTPPKEWDGKTPRAFEGNLSRRAMALLTGGVADAEAAISQYSSTMPPIPYNSGVMGGRDWPWTANPQNDGTVSLEGTNDSGGGGGFSGGEYSFANNENKNNIIIDAAGAPGAGNSLRHELTHAWDWRDGSNGPGLALSSQRRRYAQSNPEQRARFWQPYTAWAARNNSGSPAEFLAKYKDGAAALEPGGNSQEAFGRFRTDVNEFPDMN
jgi:hypothetical protein